MTGIVPKSDSNNPLLQQAANEIYSTYGDMVSFEEKAKSLNKFGENLLVGTGEATLMTLPTGVVAETYVSTNAIDRVSSSSGSDTGSITIEGHTISGGELTFVVQSVTLTGQTAVTLPTPMARANRVYNTSASDWVGSIYVHEADTLTAGVPDTDANIHLTAPPVENQSLKAATSISNADYYVITSVYAAINDKTAAAAVIRLKIRSIGGVFRTQYKLGITSTGGGLTFPLDPYIIVPRNSDIILTAEADGAGTEVAGGFTGYLAKVK